MKLSIVIPVLDSHEILRRQFLHWERMGMPDDTELIIVDDGSDPPLEYNGSLPVTIIKTNDKRPWTWALARNAGVRIATGEYVCMYDLDHIMPKESLDVCRNFNGDKVYFKRSFGILTEDGKISQDIDTLIKYGLPEKKRNRSLRFGSLPNNICLKREVFWEMGGYREDKIGRPYPQGEDRSFKKSWGIWTRKQDREIITEGTPLYMFPNGYFCGGDVDYNPFNLFHKLSRASRRNHLYRKQKERK